MANKPTVMRPHAPITTARRQRAHAAQGFPFGFFTRMTCSADDTTKDRRRPAGGQSGGADP